MKISTILDHIDNGHMALPEFQRGYVWNRDQVRGLFDSLYKRHPVGGLLVWATESKGAQHRGDGSLASGIVKLLLDGQQRMTSIYGVARGRAPKFFDGDARAFTGLRFHLESETFEFYQPLKMKDDPTWIDVSELISKGLSAHEELLQKLGDDPRVGGGKALKLAARVAKLQGILDIDMHIEEVTGMDKTLDVVVDIFNRVNSGGTKLSKGDLALAKICADWPDARVTMKSKLGEWQSHGYSFSLDWLLRSVNTVLTGEAKFEHLHERSAEEVRTALSNANNHIDYTLNLIAGRLGLDHDRVFFGRFGVPVMVRYIDNLGRKPSTEELDKLLFWYLQAAMWGRFSGSTESFIDRDLEVLQNSPNQLEGLLEELRVWHGGLKVEAAHFKGWGLGARFYPLLYLITRVGQAKDWGTGLALKSGLLGGKMNRLEVHHIFPKAQLYKRHHGKSEVNAIANFCFLTKDTNLDISDTLPEVYFPEIERKHPGALKSQWIPEDPKFWKIENYADFLEARRELLAAEVNRFMSELLHNDLSWISTAAPQAIEQSLAVQEVDPLEEENQLRDLNGWMVSNGLPEGQLSFELADQVTGQQKAIFDLAWPEGIQTELSEPATLLLNESAEVLAAASAAGYRAFVSIDAFKRYVEEEIISEPAV